MATLANLALALVTPPTDTVPAWVFGCGLLLCMGVVVVLLGMRRRGDD